MDIVQMGKDIYADPQVKYLVGLVIANLVLSIVAAIKGGDFQLSRVGDWIWQRLLVPIIGYGVAAFLAFSNGELSWIKDAAWITLSAGLLGYVLAALRDIGFNLPNELAGKYGEIIDGPAKQPRG